ncbi:hypothetical protein RJ640_015796 [Escallonia rubra]|uniref:Uncharacterized protein n=1 Tax=Escallonia rubra TaxID=112253 RepID=A0AA88UCD4_9ASTE|nr:hypothetical protein RJ640_015796 [Escallonia rubra]
MAHKMKSGELLKAQTHIMNHHLSALNSAALTCAVKLGIADVINSHGKPMTISDLVARLPIHPAKGNHLQQLMRILVHSGFFIHQEEGFSLAPASWLLLTDEPLNAKSYTHLKFYPHLAKAFDLLSDWFQNEVPTAFEMASGTTFWNLVASDPRFGATFNEAMACDSRLINKVLISECKHVFEGLTSLVDVAGGTGTVARAISDVFPDLKCTVFDQHHVVANLEGSQNLKFVGGDMFEAIPSANAILLKNLPLTCKLAKQWILHDWNDEQCVKILKKCKEAIPSKEQAGKLIIIDMVMENQKQDHESAATQHLFDILMMVLFAGKERNEKEWAQLFSDAGFSSYKITPGLGTKSIIELCRTV